MRVDNIRIVRTIVKTKIVSIRMMLSHNRLKKHKDIAEQVIIKVLIEVVQHVHVGLSYLNGSLPLGANSVLRVYLAI